MPNEYMCGYCGVVTVEVYNSHLDSGNNSLFSLPDDFNELPKEEQELVKSRNEEMIKLLEKLSDAKKMRIISSIEKGHLIVIMVCPNCRKVYDSRRMPNDEDYSHQQGSMPVRKIEKKVISDDMESIKEATESEFEEYGQQDVFVYSGDKPILPEQKKPISISKFYDTEANYSNITYVADELNRIKKRSDKDISSVKIGF